MLEKAFKLVLEIYHQTESFPSRETYGLISQMRRAGISIASNIAEGEGRNSRAEFRRFLFIAHGSLRELETQILIAESLGYLNAKEGSKLRMMTAEVGRLINGLSRFLGGDPESYCRLPTKVCFRAASGPST